MPRSAALASSRRNSSVRVMSSGSVVSAKRFRYIGAVSCCSRHVRPMPLTWQRAGSVSVRNFEFRPKPGVGRPRGQSRKRTIAAAPLYAAKDLRRNKCVGSHNTATPPLSSPRKRGPRPQLGPRFRGDDNRVFAPGAVDGFAHRARALRICCISASSNALAAPNRHAAKACPGLRLGHGHM